MTTDHIRQTLAKLHAELEKAGEVDEETKALLEDLSGDIRRLLDSTATQADDEISSVRERAESLETRFAVEHPTAEKFIREIVDSLGKMGI